MKAYELKISLKGAKPPIWRKVIVPSGINFMQLHNVIQVAMGWYNAHMYEFSFKEFEERITNDAEACEEYEYAVSKEGKKRMAEVGIPFYMPKSFYAKDICIDKYIQRSPKFKYIYDFGDYWEHTIEVVNIIDAYVGKAPIVTKFRRACPPEDCGGIYGYYELMELVADPTNPECEQMREWLDQIEYSGEYDIDAVNEEMTYILEADFDLPDWY